MSLAQINIDQNNIITSVEPIFISYYKDEIGTSPTQIELKQYLVSNSSEKLISILKNSDSATLNTMPATDLLVVIKQYIRKLRVW